MCNFTFPDTNLPLDFREWYNYAKYLEVFVKPTVFNRKCLGNFSQLEGLCKTLWFNVWYLASNFEFLKVTLIFLDLLKYLAG